MDVGVRELKAKLAEYLDRAGRGETIRVTHRGRPKALLVAPPPAAAAETARARGVREGWLTPAPRRDRSGPPPRVAIDRTIAELLDEDRDG